MTNVVVTNKFVAARMVQINLTQRERQGVQAAGAVGGAIAGALGGAIKGAVKGAAKGMAQAPPQQTVIIQQGYAQQQPQTVIVQQAPAQPVVYGGVNQHVVAQGMMLANMAYGGTQYPPVDACLCCGYCCGYTALTSADCFRCHNHSTCCCWEVQTCCCTSMPLEQQCCVDHLGCKAPAYECCHCGLGGCCHSKVVSPQATKVCCAGHSQCCFQVSAVAIPCSGRTGVPPLLTLGGVNLFPQMGCCLVTGDAMRQGGVGQAPANDMAR